MMKKCPKCNNTYANGSLNFCLEDGTTLILVNDDFETEVLPKKKSYAKIIIALASLAILFVFSLVALIGIYQFRNEIASLFKSDTEITNPKPSPTPEISTELNDEEQILDLFKRLRKAYVEDDFDELDKIMADGYIEKNSFGQRLTKKQILSPVQVGKKISLEHSDLDVEVNGKKATVTGKGIQRAEFGGVEVSVRFTFETKLRKKDNRWQATYSDVKIKS